MIDEKKLIKYLIECQEKDIECQEKDEDEKEKDFLEDMIWLISEQPQVGGWIPVSERLPEDGETVLVWFEYYRFGDYNRLFQTYGLSFTFKGKWSGLVNGETGWKDLRIIAWQPLPKPFKESEE